MAENWAETTRTVDFQKNVEFQLAETPGEISQYVGSTKNYSGKKEQIVDRFDDMPAREIEERNGDTVNSDPNVERRWITKPKRQAVAPLLDPDDVMSTSVDIKSPLVMGTTRSIRYAQDDRWLQGYFGTAYTGEEGATAVPFKPANILPADFGGTADTWTGITFAKIKRIRRWFAERHVSLRTERPIWMLTAAGVEQLLGIEQVINQDYNPQTKALQNGEVADFLGFRWVPIEFGDTTSYPLGAPLTLDSDGNRLMPVFVPSGLHKGVWLDFQANIDLRPDKNHSTQIAGYTCTAVARLNEDKTLLVAGSEDD